MTKKLYSIPRWDRIPFLVHGFGTREWTAADFGRREEWKAFRPIFLDQVHSARVHVIDRIPSGGLQGDAMLTTISTVFLVIQTADCLPVLMVDSSRHAIAAVHCGWKGTQKRIVERAVRGMRDRYGCDLGSLEVGLGPCIQSSCYEVGEDVKGLFEEGGLSLDSFRAHPRSPKKYFLDLREANMSQLRGLGVKEENIFSLDTCNHCCRDFPSFRRDGDGAGRMLSFIGLKKGPV